MNIPLRKSLGDMAWVALDGAWSQEGVNGLCFEGGEYDAPAPQKDANTSPNVLDKWIMFGTALFSHRFRDGSFSVEAEFETVDYRSSAEILLQYDPS